MTPTISCYTYAEITQQLVPILLSKHFALAVIFALECFQPHFTVPRVFIHGSTHVIAWPVSKLFEGFLDRWNHQWVSDRDIKLLQDVPVRG